MERLPDNTPTTWSESPEPELDDESNDKTLIRPVKTMKQLTAKIELDNGISFSINEGNLPLRIGRGRDCDIRVPKSSVSRQQCELLLENGALFLKDTSTNGTIVGNKRLKGESVLIDAPMTIIFAGDTTITITPSVVSEVITDKSFKSRQDSDRRQAERRTIACVVQFERRSDNTRRKLQRREVSAR